GGWQVRKDESLVVPLDEALGTHCLPGDTVQSLPAQPKSGGLIRADSIGTAIFGEASDRTVRRVHQIEPNMSFFTGTGHQLCELWACKRAQHLVVSLVAAA